MTLRVAGFPRVEPLIARCVPSLCLLLAGRPDDAQVTKMRRWGRGAAPHVRAPKPRATSTEWRAGRRSTAAPRRRPLQTNEAALKSQIGTLTRTSPSFATSAVSRASARAVCARTAHIAVVLGQTDLGRRQRRPSASISTSSRRALTLFGRKFGTRRRCTQWDGGGEARAAG